jgi:hypothetical protein
MLLMLAKRVQAMGTSEGIEANDELTALFRQLGDANACRNLSERYHASLDFRRDFHTRVGQLLVPAASPPGVFAWPTPPADESAIEIARTEIGEIQSSMRRVAIRIANAEGAHVIVFGHTHRPYLANLEDGITLVNCGTWGWLGGYDPTEADAWHEIFARPNQIMPRHRLTYARIDYDKQDVPHVQLLDFPEKQGEKPAGDRTAMERILARVRRA